MSAIASAWITPVTTHQPTTPSLAPVVRRDRLKRVFDVTATFVGLVLIAPLLLAVAIAVKVSDGGPVLFEQERVGRHGVQFTMYKFRSMVVDAESRKAELLAGNETAAHLFKMRHDPRVTTVGQVLRTLSLDELPQLVNVLLGHMSLVGPRPHLADEVARMSPEAQRRAEARPGLTGLWQVSGRSTLDEASAVALDLRYVDHGSFGLDLAILVRTVGAVLLARGAH